MNTTAIPPVVAILCIACSSPPVGSGATNVVGTSPPAPVGDWSCVASTAAAVIEPQVEIVSPTPPASNVLVLQVREAYSWAPVRDVNVAACTLFDQGCAVPEAQAVTDALGNATLVIPEGVAAFDGYLHVTGPYMTTNDVFFTGRHVSAGPGATNVLTVYTPVALDITADAAEVKLDPSKGIVRVDAFDCAGVAAQGVSVQVNAGEPVTTAYFENDGDTLSCSASVTDATGTAIAFGVPPGAVSVVERLDGQPVAGAIGFVRVGAVTSVVTVPGA